MSEEKATLQVTFPKEKLDALRFYMDEKDLTVEGELQKHIKNIYEKYVPSATRRYLERNDNEQENQTETTAPISESSSEVTPRATSNRGRRRTERVQSEQAEVPTETINAEEIEESQEQTEDENQGMVMSM
jgi:cation transport regulator ChaB